MLEIRGSSALSAFRSERLLGDIRETVDAVEGLRAQYVHFVDVSRTLSSAEEGVLRDLLTYGSHESEPPAVADAAFMLTVIPRIGTISPWSSKSSDIAHSCGLDAVRRIERGVAYQLVTNRSLSSDETAIVARCLHDRMTESFVIGAVEAESVSPVLVFFIPRSLVLVQ